MRGAVGEVTGGKEREMSVSDGGWGELWNVEMK